MTMMKKKMTRMMMKKKMRMMTNECIIERTYNCVLGGILSEGSRLSQASCKCHL